MKEDLNIDMYKTLIPPLLNLFFVCEKLLDSIILDNTTPLIQQVVVSCMTHVLRQQDEDG